MTELKRATEAPDYLVDEDVGALLNTNERGLAAYRRQRAEVQKSQKLARDVEDLKDQMSRIELLLMKALQK